MTDTKKVNIYQAMLKAQGEFDKVTRTDEAFNYKYAPLDAVINATRKGLSDNGLVIMQFPINEEDRVGVKTILAHESGETIENQYTTSSYKKDPQGVGSLITYFRRYAYMAVCGIAPEDDDAQGSMPTRRETVKVEGGTVSTVKTNVEVGPMCKKHGVPFLKKEGKWGPYYSHAEPTEIKGWCNKKAEEVESQVEDETPDPTEDF